MPPWTERGKGSQGQPGGSRGPAGRGHGQAEGGDRQAGKGGGRDGGAQEGRQGRGWKASLENLLPTWQPDLCYHESWANGFCSLHALSSAQAPPGTVAQLPGVQAEGRDSTLPQVAEGAGADDAIPMCSHPPCRRLQEAQAAAKAAKAEVEAARTEAGSCATKHATCEGSLKAAADEAAAKVAAAESSQTGLAKQLEALKAELDRVSNLPLMCVFGGWLVRSRLFSAVCCSLLRQCVRLCAEGKPFTGPTARVLLGVTCQTCVAHCCLALPARRCKPRLPPPRPRSPSWRPPGCRAGRSRPPARPRPAWDLPLTKPSSMPLRCACSFPLLAHACVPGLRLMAR